MKKRSLLPLIGVISTVAISGCHQGMMNEAVNELVECNGVSNSGNPLLMPKEICDKLPNTGSTVSTTSNYVHCYGVAAAGKNDCANGTVSCAGNVKVERDPNSFISLPKGLCDDLKGSSTKSPAEK